MAVLAVRTAQPAAGVPGSWTGAPELGGRHQRKIDKEFSQLLDAVAIVFTQALAVLRQKATTTAPCYQHTEPFLGLLLYTQNNNVAALVDGLIPFSWLLWHITASVRRSSVAPATPGL